MKTIKVLFLFHCAAIVLGLLGLLVMLPHPEIWDGSASGVAVFSFNMTYTGSFYILFGAATMLLFGLRFVGIRKTVIFFCAATVISLSMELLGTSTGFPFGPYAYTDLLGFKVLGHVPYSIPLSWFYMGFTSYLLASFLVARTGWKRKTFWSLLLGVYFLTVWDLSLDPAMASPHMLIPFWHWYEAGPYFGMPIRNLVGWSLTGLTYMGISRLCWRSNAETKTLPIWLPFGVYVANTVFAIALTLDVGIWQPSLIALFLGILPATLVLRSASRDPGDPKNDQKGTFARISHLFVRQGSARMVKKQLSRSEVIGLENIPQHGPVLLVARHFHHLYDGCLMLQSIPRRLHILVALDWIERPLLRRFMEGFCSAVAWPIILREERLQAAERGEATSAYRLSEGRGYLRRASALVVRLLRQREVLALFPEAYPVIDPHVTVRPQGEAFLPFLSGFARLLELAEKDGKTRVAVIPTGLEYTQEGRWRATMRFGPPLWRADFADTTQFVRAVEQRVHELSAARTPMTMQPQV